MWVSSFQSPFIDPSGQNANVFVPIRFTNTGTGETQTRTLNGTGLTSADLQTFSNGVISSLNARDASYTSLKVQAGSGLNFLATG